MDNAQVKRFFDVVDADHSGEIDVHELQRALALGDLNFSLSIVAHMIRLHDADGRHKLSLAQFRDLNTFLTSTQADFRRADKSGAGKLGTEEVSGALSQAGYSIDRPAFEALFRSFDSDSDGKVGLPEFIALQLFLRSISATFCAFDPQQTGRVTMDFNQMIYGFSNCRS
ncbi:hypothetical protein WJX81_001097 [Elliptochloris bilobata]|uniref:EF-hand domain-containing protein n=1 Tax=Elliptochloris bilobata TaxID=381761 RepID=A0AAW1QVR9_9CHLO